jgi:hypothetical protein
MVDVPVQGYQTLWMDKLSALKSEYQTLMQQYPEADAQLKQLLQVLGDIEDVARHIPASVGESGEWSAILNAAEENGVSYCKGLRGKPLFSALYSTYTVTLQELKAVIKARTLTDQTNIPKTTGQQTNKEDDFQEVRRWKRHATNETTRTSKKVTIQTKTPTALNIPSKEVVTRNFFAPLKAADMDADASSTEANSNEEAVPGKTDRLLPIILTSTTNLIQLQKELKIVVRGNFEFRSTRNGTRVITRSMADFQSIKSHFDAHNLSYYSYPKSEKPMKVVIRHLPHNTPAEDIFDGLVSLGFDIISVKQMTATRRSPSDGSTTINLPLFLITLPRTTKSQEIFRPQSLCHIAISVEAYRAQNGLTQCHNCQQFGHVWENCKQPPRCL